MRLIGNLSLVLCLTAASGCQICCWGKRATEFQSPTDVRKSHYWCLGEDAVFEQPCGPSREDYGLKPTCWREWPAGGARCHEDWVGPPPESAVPLDADSLPGQGWEESVPSVVPDGGNPFRDDAEPTPVPGSHGARMRRPADTARPHWPRPTSPVPRSKLGSMAPDSSVESGDNFPVTRATRNVALPRPKTPTSIGLREAQVPRANLAPEAPSAPRQVANNTRPSLNITVSEPLPTPKQEVIHANRPLIVAVPGRATRPARRPASEAETMATLQSFMDVPPTDSTTGSPKPATMRNKHVPASRPFRLATRRTTASANDNPALADETLSALETLMSDDVRPAAAQ